MRCDVMTDLGYRCEGCAACEECVGGDAQLFDLIVAERVHPSLRVMLVVLRFPHRRTCDVLREVGEWS